VYRRVALLIAFAIPLASPPAHAGEKVLLNVFVNGVEMGVRFLSLSADGDLLIPNDQFPPLGFGDLPQKAVEVPGQGISLRSLSPEVGFSIDTGDASARLTALPSVLRKTVIDLTPARDYPVLQGDKTAGILNYGLLYSFDDRWKFRSLDIPLEVGVSWPRHAVFSTLRYSKDTEQERLVRLLTNLTRDDPRDSLTRLIVGDYTLPMSPVAGGSGTFGGVSLSKFYSFQPYLNTYPTLRISGASPVPAEIEVLLDNTSILRDRKIPAGEFRIENIQGNTGKGMLSLLLKDAQGGVRTFRSPYYLSTNSLKAGLHDYHYSLGFRREALGQKSFDYSDLTAVLFHKYGFSDSFTGAVGAEGTRDIFAGGVGAIVTRPRVGELEGILGGSHSDGGFGYNFGARYSYATQAWYIGGSFLHASENYANISLSAGEDHPKWNATVAGGINPSGVGSLSAGYTGTVNHSGSRSDSTSLTYSRNVFSIADLFLQWVRIKEVTLTDTFLVGISLNLGDLFVRMDSTYKEGEQRGTLSAQKSLPVGPGYGYRLDVEYADAGGEQNVSGRGEAAYSGTYGTVAAGYNRYNEENLFSLGLSGALVYLDRSVHATRTVPDSFAVAKVPGYPGVGMFSNGNLESRTGSTGEVVLPNIASYTDTLVAMEEKDLPLSTNYKASEKYILTTVRGGFAVDFDVYRVQSVWGRLFLIENGVRSPAEYAGLEVRKESQLYKTIVGSGGEFYLENIPPGTYESRAYYKDGRECTFPITIPSTDKSVVKLGDLTCEIGTVSP
jgi:outer membrane usher protein